ncbi:TrmH family RNA methyltransferase [Candidatus Kuenenbacteria bacterium]|nr:TrmH family RNA methyltransferase [Candidatus Kuenenbacteria bacterium]
MKKPNLIIVANRIRSLYNVGSIFRTCDAVGVEKLYLAGYTASPKDKPIQLAKTALGAEQTVPWEKISTVAPIIKKHKKLGYQIIGLEEVKNKSIDYRKFQPSAKIVLILGNEVKGISPGIQNQCDQLVSLPMLGKKKSLNVTVALGAIVYHILSKFK